jgi:FKBP-type peptidyl-prolyl cis-trans isomerase FklB
MHDSRFPAFPPAFLTIPKRKDDLMRPYVFAMICLCLCVGKVFAQDGPAAATAPAADAKDHGDVASYGLGLNMGRSLKADHVEIDLDVFFQGIRDGAQGAKPKYTDKQIQAAMLAFQRTMQAKQQKHEQSVAETNAREGQAFLAKNKTKEGVKTTASGLQYEVLRAGNGQSPKKTDTVKVHYEGKLLDGTVFDSSIKRNEPAVFPVGGVIAGWTEALQLMKVGDKWRLFVPSELAYGGHGAGGAIGPNAVLTFEVELLGIEPPAAKSPQ